MCDRSKNLLAAVLSLTPDQDVQIYVVALQQLTLEASYLAAEAPRDTKRRKSGKKSPNAKAVTALGMFAPLRYVMSARVAVNKFAADSADLADKMVPALFAKMMTELQFPNVQDKADVMDLYDTVLEEVPPTLCHRIKDHQLSCNYPRQHVIHSAHIEHAMNL
jgi:hypothetical protein